MEADLIFEVDDIPYEEEILRHPYSLKCWLRYIEHKRNAPGEIINLIYERALKELPGSYKLWYNYLRLRKEQVATKRLDDPQYEEVNSTFERALVFMHKMPRIWLEFLHFLMDQGLITRTRRTFDRALRSLPITQAYRIWKLYLKFLNLYPELEETVVRCYRRYLKLAPEDSEDFIDYLKKVGRLDEAASVLVKIINDDSFNSKHGKSKHQLWNELCELISSNPDKVTSQKIEPIIRQGIDKYQDQVGVLWNSLALYYTRSNLFERARDIYEEAMSSVMRVSDFSLVFDAYSDMQHRALENFLKANADQQDEEIQLELEYMFCRNEDLLERRDLLQNSVCLRQNPHNVDHWLRRVRLYKDQPNEIIKTYTQALETISPKEASGKLYLVWTDFAHFYENAGQIDEARLIFERGMNVKFNSVNELANLVLKRVEMEERHKNYKEALRVLRKAVVPIAGVVDYHDSNEQVQNRLFKSHKVWEKLAELEQAFGTYETCKSVYSRMMDYKIATPQDIVNCAVFHEDARYFEESFKVYERGISLFKWPNVNEIWKTYLQKFMMYAAKKLERTRDLFEQCLDKCPSEYAKPFYLMYAKLEEDNGQVGLAMAIYDRATSNVPVGEQYEMFNIYLKKASKLNDIIATRPIFKKAIENLPLAQSVEMGLRYAEQETKIGEIDRARALYTQCSEGCDPKIFGKFWDAWKDFEMQHGNENTLSEMLRVKRSVIAGTNTQMNCLTAQKLLVTKRPHEEDEELDDSMRNLEKKARMIVEEAAMDQPKKTISFVRSEATTEELGELTKTNNPDEISIADDDEEEGEANDEVILEKREIPSKVFGKFIPKTDDD